MTEKVNQLIRMEEIRISKTAYHYLGRRDIGRYAKMEIGWNLISLKKKKMINLR